MKSRIMLFLTVILFSNCKRENMQTPSVAVNNPSDLIRVNEIPPGTPKSKVNLYILLGQSNMVGLDKTDLDYWNDVGSNSDHLQMYVEGASQPWVKAKHPIHYASNCGVGPGLAFGNKMWVDIRDSQPDAYIGLIPCAVGSTSIQDWLDDTNSIYTNAKNRIEAAEANGVVKGMIWLQGEADTNPTSPFITPGYFTKLKTFFTRVRTLVNRNTAGNELPIVVGEIGEFYATGDPDGHKNFNNNLADIINSSSDRYIPKTRIATSEDLIDRGDHLHYNSASATTMGRRMGDKMILMNP